MTRVETVKVGGALVCRATMEPGWRWSEAITPIGAPTAVRCNTSASFFPAPPHC